MMRLRINRIALIQELRVEHVLCSLIEAGILNEDDLKQITSGSTAADKARVLVDMLPGMYVVCLPKSDGLELSDKKVKLAACQDFCRENVCSLYLLHKFKCTTEYTMYLPWKHTMNPDQTADLGSYCLQNFKVTKDQNDERVDINCQEWCQKGLQSFGLDLHTLECR